MNKGKLLASANGKKHSSIVTWWIIELIGAVACVAIGFWLANKYGHSGGYSIGFRYVPSAKNELYNIYMHGGVFLSVLSLIMAYLTHTRISRTFINVYENGIEGSSVVPKFPLSFMLYGSISSLQLADFQLTYEQVSSVDVVNENTIIINAGNVQHKIYAMNSKDIRDAILSQKNKEKA
jgi:hypothetical protein